MTEKWNVYQLQWQSVSSGLCQGMVDNSLPTVFANYSCPPRSI